MTEQVHHDRKATTAADTWDEEPMSEETALELLEKLQSREYSARLVVEAKHEDSAVIKTVDNQEDAETTLANIRVDEEYNDE
ncbi:hypothetical protein [Natrialba taiwanensis]|uniref:Uncharacterized protein n=1 Tax=Natrialba taiwanensis DSM 12281 TaxID=1230458 RepID=L9ZZC8_9EURY|nr:hypothetical protein [Natrialba taiwanensis]ELY91426.1 hypothetical protein C484_10376 [Natrialba taiwanensis DSM 12281]